MTDKEFDDFARIMGMKAVLLLIQTDGKEVTANGEEPDEKFLKEIPRYLKILEEMVDSLPDFREKDLKRGVVRMLAKMARESQKQRRK